jgi:thiosulfate dehydrogenase (quinone) large subunit
MLKATTDKARRLAQQELSKDGAYLLPLRLFIGMGWLRASAEKIPDPGWYDGTALTAFLEEGLAGGHIVFPFYRALITDVFLPNAGALGVVVMIGELLAGAAILVGMFTNAALLGGMFMNLNFILAGAPDPSAFYFLIQVALFVGGIGAIAGADALLGRRVKNPLLVAQNRTPVRRFRTRERVFLGLAALWLGLAAYALAHVSTLDPGRSVEDPAMILGVLFGLSGVQAFIAYLRQRPTENASRAPDAPPHPARGEPPSKRRKAARYPYSS